MVESSHEEALTNIKRSQEQQKKTQNRQNRVDDDTLEPGTFVYVKTEGILSKLTPRYRGPYKVVKVTN